MKKLISILISISMILVIASCSSGVSDFSSYINDIAGDYQIRTTDSAEATDDDYWHLSIYEDEELGPYLSIYDNLAGNPGVEGIITEINDTDITVQIDPDYYDQLPSYDWQDSGDTLEISYKITDEGIILTNNDTALRFVKE